MVSRTSPLPGQVLRAGELDEYDLDHSEPQTDIRDANLITSEVADKPGRHKIILDLDVPAQLIPSSTEGHFHLLIDHELSWEQYQRLLWTLADLDLVEEGYVSASVERGYSAVRLPWVRKGDCFCGDTECEHPSHKRTDDLEHQVANQ